MVLYEFEFTGIPPDDAVGFASQAEGVRARAHGVIAWRTAVGALQYSVDSKIWAHLGVDGRWRFSSAGYRAECRGDTHQAAASSGPAPVMSSPIAGTTNTSRARVAATYAMRVPSARSREYSSAA